MNIKDRIRIFDYVKKKVSNNTKDRLLIELNIPCSINSDDCGSLIDGISLEIINMGYDFIFINNPEGASNSTAVHLFVFSSSEDKKKFQESALKLHKEVDKKILDIFNSGTSVPYEQLEEDVKDIQLTYECNAKDLKI